MKRKHSVYVQLFYLPLAHSTQSWLWSLILPLLRDQCQVYWPISQSVLDSCTTTQDTWTKPHGEEHTCSLEDPSTSSTDPCRRGNSSLILCFSWKSKSIQYYSIYYSRIENVCYTREAFPASSLKLPSLEKHHKIMSESWAAVSTGCFHNWSLLQNIYAFIIFNYSLKCMNRPL